MTYWTTDKEGFSRDPVPEMMFFQYQNVSDIVAVLSRGAVWSNVGNLRVYPMEDFGLRRLILLVYCGG